MAGWEQVAMTALGMPAVQEFIGGLAKEITASMAPPPPPAREDRPKKKRDLNTEEQWNKIYKQIRRVCWEGTGGDATIARQNIINHLGKEFSLKSSID